MYIVAYIAPMYFNIEATFFGEKKAWEYAGEKTLEALYSVRRQEAIIRHIPFPEELRGKEIVRWILLNKKNPGVCYIPGIYFVYKLKKNAVGNCNEIVDLENELNTYYENERPKRDDDESDDDE